MTTKSNNKVYSDKVNQVLTQPHATLIKPNTLNPKVGIIGGGVAGSTIAIRLAALGLETYLLESKPSLIDGPPMCHLHAGGNLYREIPDEDCVQLLKQSIDMLRMYPHSIDVRPTVIAIPTRDEGDPEDLLPRLELLTNEYKSMIAEDPANKVLGEAEDYYRLYHRQDLEALIASHLDIANQMTGDRKSDFKQSEGQNHTNQASTHEIPKDMDHWVVNAAKQLDLEKLKFPIVAVQEYGWNIFRLAASAQIALGYYPNAKLMLNTQVVGVTEANRLKDKDNDSPISPKWQIQFKPSSADKPSATDTVTVDYLINACGFKTGIIDNMVGVPAQRMVEFKASYVTHWDNATAGSLQSSLEPTKEQLSPLGNKLPEIIIHGKRGTPHGMVQLTPYPDGYYQIHSMNKEVTLFKDGLVATQENDAQPELEPKYIDCIEEGWNPETLHLRSQRAIEQVSEFVPRFASARPTGNALYGGQQIPGENDSLRVADVSLYPDLHYARAENVKASSALEAADDIVELLQSQHLITPNEAQIKARENHEWVYLHKSNKQTIDDLALEFAGQRAFPLPMSGVVNPF